MFKIDRRKVNRFNKYILGIKVFKIECNSVVKFSRKSIIHKLLKRKKGRGHVKSEKEAQKQVFRLNKTKFYYKKNNLHQIAVYH